jgi:5-methylcytosine-specific restriction endonuclease McrA
MHVVGHNGHMPKALKKWRPPGPHGASVPKQRCGDPFYATKAWRATRAAVLVRDEYTCHYCQCPLYGDDATVDHVQARASGGDDYNPANLVAACRRCNSRKGDRATCPVRGHEPSKAAVGHATVHGPKRDDAVAAE